MPLTPSDLRLIALGRHPRLWDVLGAHPTRHRGVRGSHVALWAPGARSVGLATERAGWDGAGCPLRPLGDSGVWEGFAPGLDAGARYRFDIVGADGTRSLRADPMARRTERPPGTASVVHASRHRWRDAAWLAARRHRDQLRAPVAVYELHAGSWRPGLGYRELATELPPYLTELGFTHVELMPVAEHPYGGSWGYQVTGYYAPTSRLGTPDDLKYLIDALHRADIGVIMDWVPAHFPKDDWALARLDGTPCYEHPDPRRAEHPDWGTLEFDYGRPEVRNFLISNAVYWCEEYHLDGLRVDAVASMLYLDYSRGEGQWSPNAEGGRENLEAVSFLRELNATVHARCPGLLTIAEESTAWDGVTRPVAAGGLGFDLKWNMGWMHDSLRYLSHDPVHRRFHHDEITFSLSYAWSERYVLPVSHDEVVHGKRPLVAKMPGDWWRRRATHRAYLAFMWAHPGKQLLFMGQEFAQGTEWSDVAGPQWWVLDDDWPAAEDHRGVQRLVADLNHTYRATPALWELDHDPAGFAWLAADRADDNVVAFLRLPKAGPPLLAISNFCPVVREDYPVPAPPAIPAWTELLTTDAERYGGSGLVNSEPIKHHDDGIRLTLPPLATVWLRPA
ncbi:1,4-alpha-glucan branching protein GlgB [Streptomyces sp. NPDC127098]|uniref:1,4-alpha-glucan branching protein GlgB n=1 Tax=Streptomyces sp. NPDC127098 TaxID=3347137 RepID=UPI00365422C1